MSSLTDSWQKMRERMGGIGRKSGGGEGGDGAPSQGSKFDAKAAIGWVKRNPAIVASLGVLILAPVVAWWFASDLHAAADELSNKRATEMAELEKLEKSSVEIVLPGKAPEAQTGVVTPKMVAAYEELAGKLRTDAMEVQRQALKHNQGDRNALIAPVKVEKGNQLLIADEVFNACYAHLGALMDQLKVGAAPSEQGLADQLQRRQDQFIAGERKSDRKSLNDEQLARLRAALLDKRLQIYADAATGISFYADKDRLGLPVVADAGTPPHEGILFDWQWRTWIAEDLLRAFAAANKPYRCVLDAPVKRVISMTIFDDPAVSGLATAASAETPAGPDGAAPGAPPPAEAGAAPAEGAAAAAAATTPIDPKTAVAYNFASTFTGRVTGPLYDVRRVSVRLIVATAMLPEVLNAIGRQNFMTVTNLRLAPADAFVAADEGYIYGQAPVSEVTMTVETVWMREWMGKLMPPDLQRAKGTDGRTTDQAAAPSEGGAAAPTT